MAWCGYSRAILRWRSPNRCLVLRDGTRVENVPRKCWCSKMAASILTLSTLARLNETLADWTRFVNPQNLSKHHRIVCTYCSHCYKDQASLLYPPSKPYVHILIINSVIICVRIQMLTVQECTRPMYTNSHVNTFAQSISISSSNYFKFSSINSVLKTHIHWYVGGISCTIYVIALHLKSASVFWHRL